MKLWLISKRAQTPEGEAVSRVALVRDPSGISGPYVAEGFVVVASAGQKDYIRAAAEVDLLSQDARNKLGITFGQRAGLQERAEPNVPLVDGDILYLAVRSGTYGPEDGRPVGVYTYYTSTIPHETFMPMTVYQNLGAALHVVDDAAVEREIAGMSPMTKKILGLKT